MSRNFVSCFSRDLSNMIEWKVSLGGAESTYLSRAKNFDQFCAERHPDASQLTEPLVMEWIKTSENAASAVHNKVTFMRGFAVYLRATGSPAYVLPDNFTTGRSIFVPYIFTDSELSALFREIDSYTYPKDPFRPILLSAYFRLTYTCGLRPGESRNLKRNDIDLDSGEIQIMNTKMKKSRLIIMSRDMLSLTRSYVVLRDTAYPESEYLFPSPSGKPYSAQWIQTKFKQFWSHSNPGIPKEFLPAVRVYDLRHRFATAVLNRWLDEKRDINSRLPYLRVYMGHKELEATAYYIHLLPENLSKSAGVDWERMGQIFPRTELWEE